MTAKSNKRASEPRRANKPLMEKRRRARINQSLAALKMLILDTAKTENAKHSKLEKADILELTVRHFQRHRSLDVQGVNQYKAGYSDCVREVQRYLETPDAHTMTLLDAGVKQRLLRHLDNCVAEADADLYKSSFSAANATPSDRLPADSSEENNNEPPGDPSKTQDLSTAKMVKTSDGNVLFVLPSHYLQLASALGITLIPCNNRTDPDANSEILSLHPHKSLEDRSKTGETEKPLDFSKNNVNVHVQDMWRPW